MKKQYDIALQFFEGSNCVLLLILIVLFFYVNVLKTGVSKTKNYRWRHALLLDCKTAVVINSWNFPPITNPFFSFHPIGSDEKIVPFTNQLYLQFAFLSHKLIKRLSNIFLFFLFYCNFPKRKFREVLDSGV